MARLVVVLLCAATLDAQDRLDFLEGLPDFATIRQMLPAWLNRQGFDLLDARARNLGDAASRRRLLRERVVRAIGGLPDRTPLNPRVVGTLDRDGYRVEKIVFESQPGFYVTANLYLPNTGRGPYPGVLFPIGHETGAKAHSAWQQILITVARHGYVALAWDHLGQGERSQFFDPALGESRLGRNRSTTEHSMLGAQCLLNGDALARYTIWDGIRALDYLLSRPEVDSTRIAVTGNSGGGTHTAYIAALDDRVHAAAPSCYLTSWRRLLETIGPQDAEQCLPPFLADGLDHADFVHAFAPKPYLILSAIRDFFSINGARETYEEARRSYNALGAEDRIGMVEADDGHGYSEPRRRALYAWLARWLKGGAPAADTPVLQEPEAALECTKTGQVSTSLGGETVYSLNRRRIPKRTGAVTADVVRKVAGIAVSTAPLNVKRYGQVQRDGYHIEKLTYESEPGIVIPALLFVPAAPDGTGTLYIDGRAKSSAGALAMGGSTVLAIDPRGMGETAVNRPQDGQAYSGYFGDYASSLKAMLVGRSLVGMRAGDAIRGLDLLATRARGAIRGHGKGAGAIILLHAAVVDARLTELALEGMLVSYESVVNAPIHRGLYESIIPGVLKHYDLADLARAVAPRRVRIEASVDPLGNRVLE
ncbi:MAG: alpha/beta hydrolase family protein [Bryobacteraceae bacterium]